MSNLLTSDIHKQILDHFTTLYVKHLGTYPEISGLAGDISNPLTFSSQLFVTMEILSHPGQARPWCYVCLYGSFWFERTLVKKSGITNLVRVGSLTEITEISSRLWVPFFEGGWAFFHSEGQSKTAF